MVLKKVAVALPGEKAGPIRASTVQLGTGASARAARTQPQRGEIIEPTRVSGG
jgi:hypothetical protein